MGGAAYCVGKAGPALGAIDPPLLPPYGAPVGCGNGASSEIF
jgi:hypothetical protein